jgi:hypothetical protein
VMFTLIPASASYEFIPGCVVSRAWKREFNWW